MDEDDDNERQFICPITAYPCEGDLSYLCKEYGCARKGGLSPHSEENLMAGWPVQPQLIERPASVSMSRLAARRWLHVLRGVDEFLEIDPAARHRDVVLAGVHHRPRIEHDAEQPLLQCLRRDRLDQEFVDADPDRGLYP